MSSSLHSHAYPAVKASSHATHPSISPPFSAAASILGSVCLWCNESHFKPCLFLETLPYATPGELLALRFSAAFRTLLGARVGVKKAFQLRLTVITETLLFAWLANNPHTQSFHQEGVMMSVHSTENMPPGIGLVTEKRFRLNFMVQRHSNLVPSSQVTLMTVNPVVAKPGLTKPLAVMTPAEGLALILFCSTAAGAIFILMLLEIWQVVRTKITALSRCHQTPCRSCRFLIDNHYLPCAVHPSFVFTEHSTGLRRLPSAQ